MSVSQDGGESWTELPGARVDNATNPALAVTANGHVGFLYQQVVDIAGSKYWHSRLVVTTDDFVTKKTYRLANTPAWLPPATLSPYLGDYTDLLAVAEMFFGVFSASNDRVHSSFPCGEKLRRKVVGNDLRDVSGTITIAPSIDPYFFNVTTQYGLPPEC